MLSHLLDNEAHTYEGQTKHAVDFFEGKITDAMFMADIKRAVASETDVLLFNIDSKADSSSGRDAILAVFLKVLNEKLGYSPDHAHIAHMERYLDEKGQYNDFKKAYAKAAGHEWTDERDGYEFNRDEVVTALSETLGQSTDSCEKWIDSADSTFSLTIENFAKWVKEYLDSQGPNHRLIFLVDEVGQFIGKESALMLNLQTITEQLGTVCNGRAWVMVTSQSDIDAVLGEIKTSQGNDFSKIQARFKTRLSLSSQNVDEVITQRLLSKTDSVIPELETEYKKSVDVINNQLSFHDIGTTYKRFESAEQFAEMYPFAPYQFQLLQRVFESIRRAGATGLHLAQGERSLLDAFQYAAMSVSNENIGVLVPLYRFYPSIESFLEPGVKRTIDHASENRSLEPFDINVLQILFLIRYVDEMRGIVDNLVTLCVDEIDADRLALKHTIQDSLARLEKESLISRSGDIYYFLTNEERDISQEIKKENISSTDQSRLLGDIIYLDCLKDTRKHRYVKTKKDFQFNRICDKQPIGRHMDGQITIEVISPLADDYEFMEPLRCIQNSSTDEGKSILLLQDNDKLGRELRAWLQTDKYLRGKDESTTPQSTQRILKELGAENSARRNNLIDQVAELIANAQCFSAGEEISLKSSDPQQIVTQSLDFLIDNTFRKLNLLSHLHEDPVREMKSILQNDDIAQLTLQMTLPENNPDALDEMRNYISMMSRQNKKILMYDTCFSRFADRPYGWPEQETALLLIHLCAAGTIRFMDSNSEVSKEKLVSIVGTTNKWRALTIHEKVTASPEDVKKAREIGRDAFGEMGPESEEELFKHLKTHLQQHNSQLQQYNSIAKSGQYPGQEDIQTSSDFLKNLLFVEDSNRFMERFVQNESELLDHSERFSTLNTFYDRQKPIWDKLLSARERYNQNKSQLEQDSTARDALKRIETIVSAPAPYGLLKETDKLLRTVDSVNEQLLDNQRQQSLQKIDSHLQNVKTELEAVNADDLLNRACTDPLNRLHSQISAHNSLAHILQAESQALSCKDAAIAKITEFANKQTEEVNDTASNAGDSGATPVPKFKPVQTISASELQQDRYIESVEQAESYLEKLRDELNTAIEAGMRVEIR